jgi:hypothetical protein
LCAKHSELSHDGHHDITREAELRRPTVIGSGDWFGGIFEDMGYAVG